MCGRYSFDAEIDLLIAAWRLQTQSPSYERNTDVRPTQNAPVLLPDGQLRLLRWGFQPAFAKQPLINARSETVMEKPTFREAFSRRRCIIPATGFYEWKTTEAAKEKHLFETREPFVALAGLWEVFTIDETAIPCFTILTTQASDQMDGIHDRMPVLLSEEQRAVYLDHYRFTKSDWDQIRAQADTRLRHAAVE